MYGLFGDPKSLCVVCPNSSDRHPKEKSALQGKRKIYVSPAKKGGFGFPIQVSCSLLLSHQVSKHGVLQSVGFLTSCLLWEVTH